MTINITNLGMPQVANRAFVALAIEAGIEAVIRSLVGLAVDKYTLLVGLKQALEVPNKPLADALNFQTLDAIMDYISTKSGSAIVNANQLPSLLDADGPVSIAAAWQEGVPGQVNVTFNAPPEGWTSEIYLDGVFYKHSTEAGTEGWVNDSLQSVPAGAHTIRVLYRDGSGNISRFSLTIATI